MPYDYPHYSSATLGRRSASSSAHWSPSVISSRSYGSSSYSGLDSSTSYSPSPLSSVSLYLPPRTPSVPSSPAPSHRSLRPATSHYVTSRPAPMSSAMTKRETIIRNLVRSSHDLESHHFLSNDSVSMITNSNYYQSSSRLTPSSQPVSRPNKYSRSYTTDLSTSALASSSSPYRTSSPVYTVPERVYRDPYRPIIIERPSLSNYVPPPKEERSKALPRAIRRDRPLIKFLEREDVNPVKVRHLLDAWSKGEVLEEEGPHEEEETESKKRDSVQSNDSGIGSYRSSFLRRSRQKSGDTTNDSNQTISDSNKHDIEDNETRANLIPKAHTPSVDEGVHLDADDGFRTPTPIISPLGFRDDALDLCDESKLQNNISTGTNDDIISDINATETARVKRRVRICSDKYVDSSTDKDKAADENNNTECSQNLNDRRSSIGKRVRTSIVDSQISINQNNTEIKPDTADISNNCDLKNVLNVNSAQNEQTNVTSDKRETCIEKIVSSDALRVQKRTSLTSELKPQTSEGILIKDKAKIQTDLKICDSGKKDKQKSEDTQPEKPIEKYEDLNTQAATLESKENVSTSTEVKKKKKVKKLDGEIQKTKVKKIESNESDVGVPASESSLSQVKNLSSEINKSLPVCNQKNEATKTGVIPLKSKDKPMVESSAPNEKDEYKSVNGEKSCIPTSESDKVTQSGKIEKDTLVKLKKDPPSSGKDNSILGSDKPTSAGQSPSMYLSSLKESSIKELQTKEKLTCQKSSVSAEKKTEELGVKTINHKITANKVETIVENKLGLTDKKTTILSKESEKVKQTSDDVSKFTPKLKPATTFGDKTKLLREHEKLPPKPVVAKTKDESLNQDEINQKSLLKKKTDKIIEDTKTDANVLKDFTSAESTFSSGKSKITLNKEAKPENLHAQDLKQPNNTIQSLTKNEKKIAFKENSDKELKNTSSITIKEIDISTELKLKKERKEPTTPTQTNISEKAASVVHMKDMVSPCKIEANDVKEEKLCNEKFQKVELKDNTKLLTPETKTRTWRSPKDPKLEELKAKKLTTVEKTKDKKEESQINVDFAPSSTTETLKMEQIKAKPTSQENSELSSQPLKNKTGKEKITERKEITKQITADNSSSLINSNVLKSENFEAKPILESSNQLLKDKEHLSKVNEKNETPKKAKGENASPIISSDVSKIENSETQLTSSEKKPLSNQLLKNKTDDKKVAKINRADKSSPTINTTISKLGNSETKSIPSENAPLSSQLLTNKTDDKKVAKNNTADKPSPTLNTTISKLGNSETKIIPSENAPLSSQLLTNKTDDKKVAKINTAGKSFPTLNTTISKLGNSETKIIPSESAPLSSQLLTNKSDDKKVAKKDAVDNSLTTLNNNIPKLKNSEAKLASSESSPLSSQLLKNQKDDKKVAKNMEDTSSSTLSTNISKLENSNDVINAQLSTHQLKDKRDLNIPEAEPSSNALITEITKTAEIQKRTLPSAEKCLPTIAESKDVKHRIDDKKISSEKKDVIYKPKRRISDALLATSEKFMVKSKVTSIPEKVQSKNILNSESQKPKIMESDAKPIIMPKTSMTNQVITDKIDLIKEDKKIDELVSIVTPIPEKVQSKNVLNSESQKPKIMESDAKPIIMPKTSMTNQVITDKIDLIKEDKRIDELVSIVTPIPEKVQSKNVLNSESQKPKIIESKVDSIIMPKTSMTNQVITDKIDLIKEDKRIDELVSIVTPIPEKVQCKSVLNSESQKPKIIESKVDPIIMPKTSMTNQVITDKIDLIKEDKRTDELVSIVTPIPEKVQSKNVLNSESQKPKIIESKVDPIIMPKTIMTNQVITDKIDLIKEDERIDELVSIVTPIPEKVQSKNALNIESQKPKIIESKVDPIIMPKTIMTNQVITDKIDIIKEDKSIDELVSIGDKEQVPHCSSPKTEQTEKSKLIKLQKSASADVSPLGQKLQKNLDGDIKKLRRSSVLDGRELPATQPNFEMVKQILGSNKLKHVPGNVDNSHKTENMTSKIESGLKPIASSQKTIKRSTTEDLSKPRENLISLQKSLSTDGNGLANKTAIHDLSRIVKPPLQSEIKTALPITNASKPDTQIKEARKVCKIQRSTTAEIISNSTEKINILQKSPSAGSNNIQKVLDTQLPLIPPRLQKPPLPTPFPRKQKIQTSSDKCTTLKEYNALCAHDVTVSSKLDDSKNDAQLQGKANDIVNSTSIERKSSNLEKETQSKTTQKASILKADSSIETIVKTVDASSQILQGISSSQTLQETSSSQTLQETSSLQTLQETSSLQTLQETSSLQTLQETSSLQTLQETSSLQTLQKNSSLHTLQETSSSQTLQEINSSQTLHETISSHKLRENSSLQKLQENNSLQKLQENSSLQKLQENRPLQKLQEICSEKLSVQSSTIKSAKVITAGKENNISEKTETIINETEESSADSKLIKKSCLAITAKELQEIKSNDALSVIPTDTQIVKQSDNVDNQTLHNAEILPLENLPLTENKLNIDGKITKVKTKKDKKAKTEDGEKPKKKKKKKIPAIPVSTDDTQTESLTVINERTEDTCLSTTPIPVQSQSKEEQPKYQKEDADINNITVPDKAKSINTNENDEKAHSHELELLFNDYKKNHAEDTSKTATTEKTTAAIENSAIPKRYRIEDFNLLKVLGRGSYGKVMLAELKGRNQYFAMKCLKKNVVLHDNDVECTMIEKEVLAMGSNHPYLCTLYFTFQSQCHLFFVMEYLSGGDLMFHIQQSGRFDETRARFYAAEIVCALRYLHKHGIIYRDAKLDNICIDADGHIRLVDFGFCKLRIYRKECLPRNLCGTPDYMAPEIIKGYHYNQSVDWWSFGVLLYEMLVGQSPFNGDDEEQLFWSVCNEDVHFPYFVTKEAVGMISLLLDKNPETRLGMPGCVFGDIMRHPFFQNIDWKKIEKRELEPPFKPNVVSETDVSNFDRDFTMENAALSPTDNEVLDNLDQTQFKGFTFTNPMIFEWNKL